MISRPGPSAISVVITTYNDGRMLAEALEGVARQTAHPSEIIVVDDGSSPRTASAIVDAFEGETGIKVLYLWQQNRGPAAARNAGLERVSGRYVAFLDADDRWLADHLEIKLRRFERLDDRYSTVYDGFVEFDDRSGRRLRSAPSAEFDGPIAEADLGVAGGVPAGLPFHLHRTSALRDVGGLDPELRVNEDFDLLLRLAKVGYRIAGSGAVTVERRVHPGSLTRADPEVTFAEVERFLDKAARRGLMHDGLVAQRRKWSRLQLARALLGETPLRADEVVRRLREAFDFSGPRGVKQWAAYLVAHSGGFGVAAVRAAGRATHRQARTPEPVDGHGSGRQRGACE